MPKLYIIAGPNGAGKTTASYKLLPLLKCREFVNADTIAGGLSAFNSEEVSFKAGRIMLERISFLAAQKNDFAFESTLSSKSFLPFIKDCKMNGYEVFLIYFFLHHVDSALRRVAKRVAEGGHNIPREVVRRRFPRSLSNLVNLYLPVADEWLIFDNTFDEPELIADGNQVYNEDTWNKILKHKK